MLAHRHHSRQYAGERHLHPCPGCYSEWCPEAVVVIGAVCDFREASCHSSSLLSMGWGFRVCIHPCHDIEQYVRTVFMTFMVLHRTNNFVSSTR
jgi:hypothetical protein